MNFEQIKQLAGIYNNAEIWDVKPGYEVEIHEKVKEGNNERIWKFKGLVIRVNKPNSHDGTFTVRGKVLGIDVEKTYPLCSQTIQEMILLDEKKIRRSKLYFIRDKVGKAARLKSLLTGERSYERGRKIEKRKIVDVVKETKEEKQEATEENTAE
jgi:large subunit ribosomal protein L19